VWPTSSSALRIAYQQLYFIDFAMSQEDVSLRVAYLQLDFIDLR